MNAIRQTQSAPFCTCVLIGSACGLLFFHLAPFQRVRGLPNARAEGLFSGLPLGSPVVAMWGL